MQSEVGRGEDPIGGISHHDVEKKGMDEPTPSVKNGEVPHDALGELPSTFSARQVDIIALGSNTGSAIFIGIGKGLATGGPGGLLLAYILVCTGVWANVQNLGEMTIAYPGSSNFINYLMRWVDPSLAFGAGVAEWVGWIATFAAEGSFFIILVNFWANGAVPDAALLSIFLVFCLTVFFLPAAYFAWLQYIGSLVKIILFIFLIFLSIAIIGGAGNNGYVHHGEFWRNYPVFKNGFSGFADAVLLAVWALGDQVFIGVLGSEAKSTRYSMARATNMVPGRLAFMYLASSILVGLLIPSDDPRLLSGSGTATSPFVIATQEAGIDGITHLINVCIIMGVIAMALECIFLPSRILRTMALEKLVPITFAKLDAQGRPRWTLILTAALATLLTYLALSGSGTEALNWFIAITSTSFFCNWGLIGLAGLRFRAAVAAQDCSILDEPYSWKSKLYPLCPIWAIVISAFSCVCCLYAAIKPVDGSAFTAYNFFIYTIGLIIILGATIGHKLICRTKWQDPATADLVTGRRELGAEELELLDRYYGQSTARRAASYFKVW